MTRLRQRAGRATPHAPPSRRAAAGGLLALREAAGNRAFGQLVRAAVARDPAADLKKVGVQDTWLADRLGASELGKTAGKRSIELRFFPGKTTRRALVIGGVHGTERQGVQVARLLEKDLAATPSDFSVLLVPVLFPDNAASGPLGIREREGQADQPQLPRSRQGPRRVGRQGRDGPRHPAREPAADAADGALQAGADHQPPRHAAPGEGGRLLRPAQAHAGGGAGVGAQRRGLGPAAPVRQRGQLRGPVPDALRPSVADKLAAAGAADKDLSLRAAKLIDAATTGVKGREARNLGAGKQHPSVAGNVGPSGKVDTGHWGGEVPEGTSLGDYASSRGTSIFTVEPPVNRNIADYGKGGNNAGEKVSQADRTTELQAYADAVRTVLLAN